MKQNRLLVVMACAVILSCVPLRVSMNPNYDTTRIKRIAVLDFETFDGAPESSASMSVVFEKYLLDAGYQIVERSKVQRVLSEQHLQLTGAVDPTQAISIGKLLGVDALLMGSVTVFKSSTKEFYLVDMVSTRQEPVITRKQRDFTLESGKKVKEEEVVTGYRTVREVTQVPQTYTLQAEVASVVRMIDTTNGEIIWVGNAMEDGVDTQTASEYVAKAIISDWQKLIRHRAAQKAKTSRT